MPIRDLIPIKKGQRSGSVRRESLHPIDQFRQDMNDIFNHFFSDTGLDPFSDERHSFSPCLDIRETDKEYIVECELPGMDEKDIDLTLSDDILTIRGEKKQQVRDENGDYYCLERSYGRFERNLPLPEDADADHIDASFKKGILKLRVPKNQKTQPKAKKITIK